MKCQLVVKKGRASFLESGCRVHGVMLCIRPNGSIHGPPTSSIHRSSELCQTDRNGAIIARDKQTQFLALLPVNCSSTLGDIDVGFTVRVELPITKVENVPKDQRLETVVYHAGLQVTAAPMRSSKTASHFTLDAFVQLHTSWGRKNIEPNLCTSPPRQNAGFLSH